MAVSTQDTVIIQVDLSADSAIAQADNLGDQIKQITAAQKALASQNKQTSTTYQANRAAIIELTRQQRAYIALANNETGSNKQLRGQLSLLTNQYDALGKKERDTTTAGKALQVQIAAINRELLKSESSTGRFQRNVGNYQSGLAGSVSQLGTGALSQVGGFGSYITQATALGTTAFTALRQTIGYTTEAVKAQNLAYDLNVQRVNAVSQSVEANSALEEANIALLEAKAEAEAALAVSDEKRIAAETALYELNANLVTEQEAEVIILGQLAAEQEALVSAEAERVAAEQLLIAETTALTAEEQARVATELEVAASTAASAAASEAAAGSQAALASAFSLAGGVIIGAIIAIAAAVGSYLVKLDSFADGTEQFLGKIKGFFIEVGRTISEAASADSFKGFFDAFDGVGARAKAAGQEVGDFIEVFQNLQDLTEVNDNLNQQVQNEVQLLRIQARNRSLSNDEKQKYLDKALKIESDQFASTKGLHQTIISEDIAFAEKSVDIRNKFNEDTKKQLQDGNLQIANNLLNDDKISRDAYKKLKDGYALRNSDVQQANAALEKIQNDQDKYDAAAQQKKDAALAKEKQRQEQIQKINEDRAKSELESAKEYLTASEIALQEIDLDINKRKTLYEKYGQDTAQLEKERQSRIRQLLEKFNQESLKKIQDYANQAATLRIAGIKDDTTREIAQIEQETKEKTDAIDRQILALAARAALGDQVNPDELKAGIDLRNAIIQRGEDDKNAILGDAAFKLDTQRAGEYDQQNQALTDQLQFEQDQNAARVAMNDTLLNSYSSVFGAIEDLAGKQTAIGKIAFLAQKAFAIATIVINSELERSAIRTKYSNLENYASLIPYVGEALIIAYGIAEGAEIGNSYANEGAAIASTAIAAVAGVVGKAQGGIQGIGYSSDGKGTVLPGYSKVDNMNAQLRDGEAVIVSEAARDPAMRAHLSDINVAYGGRAFSSGGVYGGSFLQSRNADITQAVFERNQLAGIIGNQIIYTAVTDINREQGRYAQVVERGTSFAD